METSTETSLPQDSMTTTLAPKAPMPFPPAPHEFVVLFVMGSRSARFEIQTSTLTSGSLYFRGMMSGASVDHVMPPSRTEDGAYIVQADPDVYKHIHHFMVAGEFPLLMNESGLDYVGYGRVFQLANFLGVTEVADWIRNKTFLEVYKEIKLDMIVTEEQYYDLMSNAVGDTTYTFRTTVSIPHQIWHCRHGDYANPFGCKYPKYHGENEPQAAQKPEIRFVVYKHSVEWNFRKLYP